ncbi:MAG: GPW/gp25 family protein [Janthinobacterium lividum]
MSSHFYKYPLRVTQLMQAPPTSARPGPPAAGGLADEHPTCSLGTSIAQMLHLLLHTRLGQLRSAPDFGCAIWDVEFESNLDLPRWEENLTRSLLAAVHQHEPRLRDVSIRVGLSAAEPAGGRETQPTARWWARISIKGMVQLTHEAFSYTTQLRIGQLAA